MFFQGPGNRFSPSSLISPGTPALTTFAPDQRGQLRRIPGGDAPVPREAIARPARVVGTKHGQYGHLAAGGEKGESEGGEQEAGCMREA